MDAPYARHLAAVLLPFAASRGCVEQELNPVEDTDPVAAVLEVSPRVIHFGEVAPGEVATRALELRNAGDTLLQVESVAIDAGASAFTLAAPWAPSTLEPGQALDLELAFTPSAVEHEATLWVDARGEEAVDVLLLGNGLFPVLELVPSSVDFGAVSVCNWMEEPVVLLNRGDADLHVDQVLVTGTGLSVILPEPLPWTLPPAEQAEVAVRFSPTWEGAYAGTLWVSSDDPGESDQASLSGTGEALAIDEYVDTFRQPDGPWDGTDVVFYVDQSASMDDDRLRLLDGFAALATRMDEGEVDWQVGVVTDDTGCVNGGVIEAGDPYAGDDFADAVWGPSGLLAESGLELTHLALAESGPGGCNEGLLRDDAKTLLVMVSDEPDQSSSPWPDWVAAIEALAPTASIVAVVGDVPGGCPTAEPGTGYHQAAMATDGISLSICEEDWTDGFEQAAELLESPTDTFELSWVPDPDTLEVDVDGVVTWAWTWDEAINAVVLDAMPPAGALVTVAYALETDCG